MEKYLVLEENSTVCCRNLVVATDITDQLRKKKFPFCFEATGYLGFKISLGKDKFNKERTSVKIERTEKIIIEQAWGDLKIMK